MLKLMQEDGSAYVFTFTPGGLFSFYGNQLYALGEVFNIYDQSINNHLKQTHLFSQAVSHRETENSL